MNERKDPYGAPERKDPYSAHKEQYSISEFLTKMAQGEQVDVGSFTRGALKEGDSAKRRRLSGGRRDFDEPVPDWLTHNDGEEVENLALSRLRQAAKKNTSEPDKANNGGGSNLIPLIGSPGLRARAASGGNRRSCDMDLSEGEEGEVWEDGELRPGWPDKWGDRGSRKTPSPPLDNGHLTPRAPPPPSFSAPFPSSRQFSGPPPPSAGDHFAGGAVGGPPGPRRHLEGPPPPPPFQSATGTSPPNGPASHSFHSPPEPPPFLSGFSPSGALPPHHLDSSRGGMRGGLENRGGGLHRSGSDPSPRFAHPPPDGSPSPRFPGPPPSFAREGDSQAMEAVSLIALMQMAAALRDTKVATEALVAVFEGGVASEEALVIEGVSVIEEALPMIIMEDISTAAEVEVVQEVRWAHGDLGVGPEEGVGELGDSQLGSVFGDNIQGQFLLVLSALFRQSPGSYKAKPITRNVEQGK